MPPNVGLASARTLWLITELMFAAASGDDVIVIELLRLSIVLFVKVSAVSRPTSVAVVAGNVIMLEALPAARIVVLPVFGASNVILEAPAIIVVAAASVLFDNVCASVVPTTSPAGATFVAVIVPVPFPCKKLPAENTVAPVPPFSTLNTPPIESRVKVV